MQKKTTIALAVAAAILGVVAYIQGGWSLVWAGIGRGAGIMTSVALLILAAFTVAGLIQAVISEKTIARWLGRESGLRGILIGGLAGALIPGGPYVYYPIAVSFLKAGADIGTIISFVTAKNLWAVSRLPLEFALLGPKLTVTRFLVTLLFPPLMGLAAQVLFGNTLLIGERGKESS